MTIKLTYELTGAGWARCQIETENSSVDITASYLSDALGNLANAVVALIKGESVARFSFDEEPGEYRWILERHGDSVRIRILEFGELWGDDLDENGKMLFDMTCRFDHFVVATCTMLKEIIQKYGPDGYKEKWVEHDFPISQLDAIKKFLPPNDSISAVKSS